VDAWWVGKLVWGGRGAVRRGVAGEERLKIRRKKIEGPKRLERDFQWIVFWKW